MKNAATFKNSFFTLNCFSPHGYNNNGVDTENSNLVNTRVIKAINFDEEIDLVTTYPNPPSADEYYVQIPLEWGDQEYRIRISDMNGKLFASSMGYPGINTVDIKNLDSGVYILEINSPQGRLYTGRFVRI